LEPFASFVSFVSKLIGVLAVQFHFLLFSVISVSFVIAFELIGVYRRSTLTPAPLPSGEGRLELALLLGEKGKG
jgi:hypothetical protein